MLQPPASLTTPVELLWSSDRPSERMPERRHPSRPGGHESTQAATRTSPDDIRCVGARHLRFRLNRPNRLSRKDDGRAVRRQRITVGVDRVEDEQAGDQQECPQHRQPRTDRPTRTAPRSPLHGPIHST